MSNLIRIDFDSLSLTISDTQTSLTFECTHTHNAISQSYSSCVGPTQQIESYFKFRRQVLTLCCGQIGEKLCSQRSVQTMSSELLAFK